MGNNFGRACRAWVASVAILVLARAAVAAPEAIKDDGGFFSSAAVSQATGDLQKLQQQYHRTVAIETFASPPSDLQGRVDGNDASKAQAYAAFAQQRAYSLGADLYVMATKSPGHLETYARDPGRTGLTNPGYERLRADLLGYFKAKQFDQGLTNLTASLLKTSANAPAAPSGSPAVPPSVSSPGPQAGPAPRSAPGSAQGPMNTPDAMPSRTGSGLFGMGGCMTGVILLVGVFLVIRVIRGLFGRRNSGMPPAGYGGQPGYGAGGYGQPGYGAPQRSGFGTGLFGGLLGGLLGSWGGNQVFGQHNTPPNTGGGFDPPAGHGGGDLGAGGGDFGGSSDAGGGGADFGGGGGDVGGGGDAGAGGGDF